MKKVDSYRLIWLGLIIRYLSNTDNPSRKTIVESINDIEQILYELNFNVTLSGLTELFQFRNDWIESKEKGMTEEEILKLSEIVEKMETILHAEANTKNIFITEDRRYHLGFLLDQPSRIFAKNIFNNMPDLSKLDFIESFKCIAFDLPTAAAFHMLRATEGILKCYYHHNIKKNREKKPMWGNMVEGLRKKKRKKPSITLLDSLDLIRISYRNPTDHPDAVYSLEECQDLLGLCIDVVNKMISELFPK